MLGGHARVPSRAACACDAALNLFSFLRAFPPQRCSLGRAPFNRRGIHLHPPLLALGVDELLTDRRLPPLLHDHALDVLRLDQSPPSRHGSWARALTLGRLKLRLDGGEARHRRQRREISHSARAAPKKIGTLSTYLRLVSRFIYVLYPDSRFAPEMSSRRRRAPPGSMGAGAHRVYMRALL